MNAKFENRSWTAQIAPACRAVLAAVAIAATWGVPTLAAAQISAPTGVTLHRGLPVLVQWTPSFWAAPTVDIILYRVLPGAWVPVGPPTTTVANNGQTHLQLPQSLVCNPADTYKVYIQAKVSSTMTTYKESPHFKLDCDGGSITVVKTVFNDSGGPVPNGSFAVDVNCAPNGPNTTLALSSATGFQGAVMDIPLGSQCTINEQTPKAPPGCRWATTYPQGRSILIANLGYRREVHNRLSCQGVKPSVSLTGPVTIGGSLSALLDKDATSGPLTILKKVLNDSTSFPPPNVPFQVQVACAPGGPNLPVTLSPANNFNQVIASVPANSVCTIVELAPAVPLDLAQRGCRWETSYPDGQGATMPNPATAMSRTVVNRWTCKGEPRRQGGSR